MSDEATINRFLAHAAHDIKQPLNILQMYLGILQRRISINEKGRELGDVVGNSLKSVQSILNLLTQWARAEEQSLKQHPKPVSLTQWVEMTNQLKLVTLHSSITDERSTTEHTIDLQLLQLILQDMIHLLPQPIELHLSDGEDGWTVELKTPLLIKPDSDPLEPVSEDYSDALFELAIEAGSAIVQQLGGHSHCAHQIDKEQSCLRLSIS